MQATEKLVVDEEMLRFAEYFSQEYNTLPAGQYESANKKYRIEYIDPKENEYCPPPPVRSHRDEYIILLNRKTILSNDKYRPGFIFYLIIWCYLRRNYQSEIETDIALKE